MKREYPIAAVVLLSALAVAGAVASPVAVTTATAQEATNASITYNDQQATDTVTVESATLPEGGYVVVYNTSSAVVGNSSLLEAGTHENITIEVSPAFSRSGVSIAEVYRENATPGVFNATESGYTTSAGNAVSSTAYITVESAETTETTEPAETTEMAETTEAAETTEPAETTETAETTEPAETTAMDGTAAEGTQTTGPGFTLVGAVVALAGAALLARRR